MGTRENGEYQEQIIQLSCRSQTRLLTFASLPTLLSVETPMYIRESVTLYSQNSHTTINITTSLHNSKGIALHFCIVILRISKYGKNGVS